MSAQSVHYLVFARFPEISKVKTRLADEIGLESALALYRAMLLDIVERLLNRRALTVFVHPAEKLDEFKHFIQSELGTHNNLTFSIQQGENLGDKMLNAFRGHGSRVGSPAIIIGTDSPNLPDAFLEMAEEELANKQAVIGGCEDGGFYLMGLHEAVEAAFFGADYSHSRVYANTLAALEEELGNVAEIPLWYDVDYLSDLRRMQADLNTDTSGSYTPKRTQSLLNKLFEPSNAHGGTSSEARTTRC